MLSDFCLLTGAVDFSLSYIKKEWDLPSGWRENLGLVQGGEHVTGTTKPEVELQAAVLHSREVRGMLFYLSKPDP